MPWPLGKPRPKKDKEAIAKGKKGVPASQEARENISRGVRAWWRRQKGEGKDPPKS